MRVGSEHAWAVFLKHVNKDKDKQSLVPIPNPDQTRHAFASDTGFIHSRYIVQIVHPSKISWQVLKDSEGTGAC